MNTPAMIAVASAAVSVLTALYGMYEGRKRFLAQQKTFEAEAARWVKNFEADIKLQQVLLEKDFLLENFRYRVAAYGDVLKTLGAVSDVSIADGSDPDPYRELHQDRALLKSTADALYDHLYGDAGLLMTMTTRNHLHTARRACLEFLASDGHEIDGVKLVDTFFHARRYLRADLELVDQRSPQRLEKLVNQLGAEDEQSKPT